jgi:hypothetical protein
MEDKLLLGCRVGLIVTAIGLGVYSALHGAWDRAGWLLFFAWVMA